VACSIGSVGEISECIFQLKEALGYAQAIWGVVSASLVSALIWVIGRWKKDTSRLEKDISARDVTILELEKRLKEHGESEYIIGLYTTISETIRNWHHPKLDKNPNIPKDKELTARKLASIPGDEELLALFDFSRLKNMSRFLVITYDGLYWTGDNRVDWQELSGSDINSTIKAVEIEDYEVIEVGGGFTADAVADMLASLHKAIAPHYENEDAEQEKVDA
jgi:hypothetical protein